MKKITICLMVFISIFLFSAFSGTIIPASATSVPGIIPSDKALCLPGNMETVTNEDCQVEGPLKNLLALEKVGITFPAAPLPVYPPPYELNSIPFAYAQVSNDAVPLYATIEDAIADHSTRTLRASRIKYVSLLQKKSTESGLFYQISTSEWISADVIKKVGIQSFQGFLFKKNPTLSFGWILSETKSRKNPESSSEENERIYSRFNIVRIYDSKVENEIEWVMVGPNEWIEHRFISRVTPRYEKPPEVISDRWIEINLYEQVLIVHEKDRIVFATLISTGVDPFFTQPGVFKIYKKIVNEYMRGAFEPDRSDYYYLEDVPFIMYYDQSRALHGAYWNTLFGYQRSHGCVNLSVADSHWLYDWANMGDFVYVWDPSGKTPTDPSLYGAGGF